MEANLLNNIFTLIYYALKKAVPYVFVDSTPVVGADIRENVRGIVTEIERLKAQLSKSTCDKIDELEIAMRFIADHGGKVVPTESGVLQCTGSWCAEQARKALGYVHE